MLKIIPKNEIYTDRNASLAGTCAMRIYKDGNITFSKQASDLLELNNNPYILIGRNEDENIFIVPNKIEGNKCCKRKGKYTYLTNSKPIAKYLSKCLNFQIEKRKPIELKITISSEMYVGNRSFRLIHV